MTSIPRPTQFPATAVAIALAISPALAETSPEPLALRNLSPLYANLGVPVMAAARLPGAGAVSLAAQWQLASHALVETAGGERLELDGETQRLDLTLRYSPTDRLRLQLNLPWVRHGGGALDGAIDRWHDVWGLPDGPRDTQPQDRLLYRFDGGAQHWQLDRSESGLGDVEMAADLALHDANTWAASAFLSGKLATGERKAFTGSGQFSAAAGVRAVRDGCGFSGLRCQVQAGLLWLNDSPVDTRADTWTSFAGLSLIWSLGDQLSLLAQVEGQGEVYREAPLNSSGAPILGALGIRWQWQSGWQLEALFTEDLQVGSAPDITFQLGIRHSVGR